MAATQGATEFDIEHIELLTDVLRRVPAGLARRFDVLPLFAQGDHIVVAMPDPNARDVLERLSLATGLHVQAVAAEPDRLHARVLEAYPETLRSGPHDAGTAEDAPAIRALDAVIVRAVADRASDIHFEPVSDGGRVRSRIDGILQERGAYPGSLFSAMVSRLKILAGMDISERRQPQDGRYALDLADRNVEARVSSMPTVCGEKLVVRLLDGHAEVPTLEFLDMPERYARTFAHALRAPHGFVVVCGPTGSGKTTTLYAAMSALNDRCSNLCSVEDPVEICIPGLAQVQVNTRAGVTFASALRGFLRQDPNVIMVGEMRDEETAAAAATASLSGQLVLTTLHANDAPTAIDRLANLGVPRPIISSGLTAVVAQRLMRKLCSECKRAFEPDARLTREFAIPEGVTAFRAAGCSHCKQTGYKGRCAIFECIFVDEPLKALISAGADRTEIRAQAQQNGYQPMLADGLRRVLTGLSTFDELRRVVAIERAA